MEVRLMVAKAGKTYIDVDQDFEPMPEDLVGADLVIEAGFAKGSVTTVVSVDGERLHIDPKFKTAPAPGDLIEVTVGEDEEEKSEVKVGDCYVTADDQIVVILEDKNERWFVSILRHRGQCDVVPWSEMKKVGFFVLKTTGDHHVSLGNWSLYKNVEDKWK